MLVPVNLKIRWFVIYAGFGLLLSIIITAIVTQAATRQIQQQVGLTLANVAQQVSYQLERGMLERLRDLQTASRLMSRPENEQQQEQLVRLVEAVFESYDAYAWIGVTDTNGRVLVSAKDVLENADVSRRPWFEQALQQPYYIGDVHGALLLEKILNPEGNEPLRFVDVSVPLQTADGQLWGVLGSHLNWQWAEQVERRAMASLQSLPGTDILLVSSENQILLGPDNLQEQPLATQLNPQVTARGWDVQQWIDGNQYLVGYAKIKSSSDYRGPEWQIIVRQPIELALQPVSELRWQAAWIGLAVALTFALVGWISAGRIARPFADLNLRLEQEVKERTEQLREKNKALQKLATTDSLTGLLNRRALFTQAEKLQAQAKRHGQALAVVMLDLDHFKQVNDRYGHAMGDEVLVALADEVRRQFRDTDICARTGGEEFTLILDGSSAADAAKKVEQLSAAFKGQPFTSDNEQFSVSLSAGVIAWDPEHSLDKALDAADKLLYQAKQKGRDCVVAASDTSAS